MSTKAIKELEERVAALEKRVDQLAAKGSAEPVKDWRRVVGMFAGDELMKQIDAEGRKIREAERRQARRERTKK
jgi:hypothetical protein